MKTWVEYIIMLLKKKRRLHENIEWRQFLINKYNISGFRTDSNNEFFNEIVSELDTLIDKDEKELYDWTSEFITNKNTEAGFKTVS